MKENNIQILKEDDETELVTEGNSILYVAQDQKIIALIGVKDTIKEESKEIIEKLKKRKIEVIMLTGDNEKTAKAIAKQLGIEKVIANVLPVSASQNHKTMAALAAKFSFRCGKFIADAKGVIRCQCCIFQWIKHAVNRYTAQRPIQREHGKIHPVFLLQC